VITWVITSPLSAAANVYAMHRGGNDDHPGLRGLELHAAPPRAGEAPAGSVLELTGCWSAVVGVRRPLTASLASLRSAPKDGRVIGIGFSGAGIARAGTPRGESNWHDVSTRRFR
jgi:hypothetical protein